MAQLVKNVPAMQKTPVQFLCQEDPWRRDRLPTLVCLGFPCGSASKESTCNVGDLGSIPGLGRSPGEGKSYPLQYSGGFFEEERATPTCTPPPSNTFPPWAPALEKA